MYNQGNKWKNRRYYTIDLDWYWEYLSDNPTITMEIVTTNLDKPWDYGSLSRNKAITFDIVLANPDIPWDWEELSCNENITAEIMEKYLDKFDIFNLSFNPSLRMWLVEKYPHVYWDVEGITTNPGLMYEEFNKNNMSVLSRSIFDIEYKREKCLKILEKRLNKDLITLINCFI